MKRLATASASLVVLLSAACATDDDAQDIGPDGDGTVIASCSDMAYHRRDECEPELDVDREVAMCEERRRRYEPLGCGKEFATSIHCYTNARIDCESGAPEGCGGSEVYGRCVSAFTSQTLCSRNPSNDADCDADLFFFNCAASVPSACTVLGPSSLGSSVCCPSFDTTGIVYFTEPVLAPEDESLDAGS